MKNLIVLISSMTFFVAFSTNINAMSSMRSITTEDSIHVWTNPELYDIATIWASAFVRSNPEAKINVSKIPANRVINRIDASGNIGLITKYHLPVASKTSVLKMAIGRDIVVPVMNSHNPFLEEIFSRGISSEEFADVYTDTGKPTWGTLLNNNQSIPVNCYSVSKESNMYYMADFLQIDIHKITGKNTDMIDEFLMDIKNDKYSLGFCSLVDIIDSESQRIKEGLSLIPIDINKNDKVDCFEEIYDNIRTLERGIWIGKYPQTLYSRIYVVIGDKSVNCHELAFLEWVLTEGQQFLFACGYSELIFNEKQSKVQKTHVQEMPIIDVNKPCWTNMALFTVALLIIAALIFFICRYALKNVNKNVGL